MKHKRLSALLAVGLMLTALPSFPALPAAAASKTLGDVNADKTVTVADGVALSRYVARWDSIEIDKETADLNQDSEISKEDATILVRYLAHWDGYDKFIVPIEIADPNILRIDKQPESIEAEYGETVKVSAAAKDGSESAATTATDTSATTETTAETAVTTTETAPVEPDFLLGDVNNDREITVDDAQLTLIEYVNLLAGLKGSFTDVQNAAADIDADGAITAADAQYILIYYVNNTLAGNSVTWDAVLGKTAAHRPYARLTKPKKKYNG